MENLLKEIEQLKHEKDLLTSKVTTLELLINQHNLNKTELLKNNIAQATEISRLNDLIKPKRRYNVTDEFNQYQYTNLTKKQMLHIVLKGFEVTVKEVKQ